MPTDKGDDARHRALRRQKLVNPLFVFPLLVYQLFMDDPLVVERALRYAKNPSAGDKRTYEERLKNAIEGVALEYAVYLFLKSLSLERGWKVTWVDRPEFDIHILTSTEQVLKIDVKGWFSKWEGKWASRTDEESRIAPPGVYYIYFDCCDPKEPAEFYGWTQWFPNGKYGDVDILAINNPFEYL